MKLLNSASFQRLEAAVQAAEMRQRIISNNIANVDTPHFKRSEVLFESMLEQSLGNSRKLQFAGKRTDDRHIAFGSEVAKIPVAKVITDQSTSMGNNNNNVDVDSEMALLAKNQLNYSFYIQQLNHDMKMMNIAIEGRG
ncbi:MULTISPECIES: flagellar basal body rod protein FlgB [unclassified Paenibacillus]|uniref:flagellar basal body rod protein FlgB n=1 Tax=unclassified Paenibacillus TaxID=185978 RepID=UPI002F40EA6D